MLKVKSLTTVLAFAMLATWFGTIVNAAAVTLTEEQKQIAAGLSANEKAALAAQAGVKLPALSGTSNPKSVAPTVMKVRNVDDSNLELQNKQALDSKKKSSLNKRRLPGLDDLCAPILDAQGHIKSLVQCRSAVDDQGKLKWFAQGQPVLSAQCKPLKDPQLELRSEIEPQSEPQSEPQFEQQPLLFTECRPILNAFADFAKDAKPLTVDTNLKQFGYELFAGSPDTFAPATDVPVPAEYVIGPGDELNIHLYGREDEDLVMVVDREGEIAFPSLGPLAVAGMNFAETKAFIAQQVKEKLVGITADISMGKLRSIRIFALGDVERPGSYTVSGLSTISNALFVSGGLKKTGSLRNIQLKRDGQVMAVIDLYDFLLKGDTSEDERLLPGDVVFVPPLGKTAAIAGQINRPGIYELTREHTVSELIGLAGGLLPTAYKDMALLERIAPTGGRSVVEISLSKRKPVTTLKNGDLLKVFSVTDYENNPVYLLGHVKRPGKYAWHEGMQLKEILPSPSMLLPEAKLDYGVIERESGINRETSIIHFNLLDAIHSKKSITLQARDKVYVFKRAQLREMPMVQISGSIQNPGKYEVKKNMRLLDLIMAAGGARRDAEMDEIELRRFDYASREYLTFRYSLGDGKQINGLNNPELQDLDHAIIHSIYEKSPRSTVYISGEVNRPGEIEWAANMHIADLVYAGGNLTEKAYIHSAELTRYIIKDGKERSAVHITIDLKEALAGNADENLLIQPHDVFVIRSISHWHTLRRVEISGEVMFPGIYPVKEGETLVDLIERAGGYTDQAYLNGGIFMRESIRKQQQQQMDDAAKRMETSIAQAEGAKATLNNEEVIKDKEKGLIVAKRLLEQTKRIKAQGRLVIELSALDRMKKSDFNLTLKDGDHLHVPANPDQVLVVGQISNSMAMLYKTGYTMNDYLQDAGGLTKMADEDEVYIVKANGRIVRESSRGWGRSIKVSPGDTIVVPELLEQFNLLDSTLDWSKVMSQLAIAAAAMVAIGVL